MRARGAWIVDAVNVNVNVNGTAIVTGSDSGGTGNYPSGYQTLVVADNGLCLDVYGANSTQGQQLDQWPCKNAPGTNQDFKP